MEPLSLRARSVLEAYKREHAPSPATLQHTRQALFARAGLTTSAPRSSTSARRWTHGKLFALATLSLLSLGLTVTLGWPRADDLVAAPLVDGQPTLFAAPARQSAVLVTPIEIAPAVEVFVPPVRARSKPRVSSRAAAVAASAVAPPTHALDPVEAEQTLDTIIAAHDLRPSAPASVSTSTTRVSKHRVASTDSQVADSSLDAEVESIRKVYGLLDDHEPQQALQTLRDHAQRFRFPKLQELAAVAQMLALCELGRTKDARRMAEAFVARTPESIHAPRVKALCKTK